MKKFGRKNKHFRITDFLYIEKNFLTFFYKCVVCIKITSNKIFDSGVFFPSLLACREIYELKRYLFKNKKNYFKIYHGFYFWIAFSLKLTTLYHYVAKHNLFVNFNNIKKLKHKKNICFYFKIISMVVPELFYKVLINLKGVVIIYRDQSNYKDKYLLWRTRHNSFKFRYKLFILSKLLAKFERSIRKSIKGHLQVIKLKKTLINYCSFEKFDLRKNIYSNRTLIQFLFHS